MEHSNAVIVNENKDLHLQRNSQLDFRYSVDFVFSCYRLTLLNCELVCY